MHFKSSHRCDDDGTGRSDARRTALDIHKFFRAQIGGKSRFGYDIVSRSESGERRVDAVTAVRDVRKGAAVHKRGSFFEGLHEVRLQSIFEQCRDRAGASEFSECNDFPVVIFSDDDIRNALFQFRNRSGETDDRHDFARDGNAKAVFARYSVHSAAESDDDVAQFAVVEIDAPLPRNRAGIYPQFIAVVNVIVYESRNQIIR